MGSSDCWGMSGNEGLEEQEKGPKWGRMTGGAGKGDMSGDDGKKELSGVRKDWRGQRGILRF